MSSNFGYIDIILLAMIAGFIILRLRSILGRKTGHEDKIYPRDKEHVDDKKTLSEVDGSQGSKLFMRNKNVKVKKSLHWKPFLEYYCNHEYWNIEYKKFLKTLPYYKKVFSKFNFGHISDNESWNNWLFS